MKSTTRRVVLLSILGSTFIAVFFYFLSGLNPILSTLLKVVISCVFGYIVYLIYMEPNRKSKIKQIAILVILLALGLFVSNVMLNKIDGNIPRTYFSKEKIK